jgi:hypothetical protein
VISLIPAPYKWLAIACAGLGCCVIGWVAQGWRLNAEIADLKAGHANAIASINAESAKALADMTADRDAKARTILAADLDRAKQAQANAIEKAQLLSDLAAARKRVYVRAVCPAASQAAGPADSARVDVPTAAELDPALRPIAADVRYGIIELESELSACKQIAIELGAKP